MKLKYTLITFVFVLLSISVSQVFRIPPYAEDIFSIYRSGYFSELDREFKIISDSFLEIKSKSEPVYGWLYLRRISEREEIEICVFNRTGYLIDKPGKRGGRRDNDVVSVMKSFRPEPVSGIKGSQYFSIIPLSAEKRCLICHRGINRGDLLGAISFRRDYDAHIYYSSERILIFLLISISLLGALYFLARWEPGKKIKEMFDNS